MYDGERKDEGEKERKKIEPYSEHVNVGETGESARSERGGSGGAGKTGDGQHFIARTRWSGTWK